MTSGARASRPRKGYLGAPRPWIPPGPGVILRSEGVPPSKRLPRGASPLDSARSRRHPPERGRPALEKATSGRLAPGFRQAVQALTSGARASRPRKGYLGAPRPWIPPGPGVDLRSEGVPPSKRLPRGASPLDSAWSRRHPPERGRPALDFERGVGVGLSKLPRLRQPSRGKRKG